MGPPNVHNVKSHQNPCHHWLLASAPDQDEAEGDDDGVCVQTELCLHLLSPLDSKINYHRPNSFNKTYSLLFNHEMIYTSAFDKILKKKNVNFQSLWSERWRLVYLCFHPSSTHHPLKMSENAEHADKNVEIWKVSFNQTKLNQWLQNAKLYS